MQMRDSGVRGEEKWGGMSDGEKKEMGGNDGKKLLSKEISKENGKRKEDRKE